MTVDPVLGRQREKERVAIITVARRRHCRQGHPLDPGSLWAAAVTLPIMWVKCSARVLSMALDERAGQAVPSHIGRPIDADDVLRHRFSAAHELGHLVLHGGSASGELWLEREADAFAAEFLTPRAAIEKELPERLDFANSSRSSDRWGVEVRSLVYRSQELGITPESTARRAYIRLAQSPQERRAIRQYEGEVPSMLNAAYELAEKRGITVVSLAEQLRWRPARVRQLLGQDEDPRPALMLVR